jgi:predicted regulator of Ras-like GTPase activity (Roadblock/LC7/MglB family)
MSEAYGDSGLSRSGRLDRVLAELVGQVPEIEAASVVSFDGLAMASALPADMDEDRVAAMSAALLSLGERAAEGLGRGALSQVYVEGEEGTVFLVSADDEAVLVAVAARGAKVGLMLFEVRRAAAAVADALRSDPHHLPAVEVAPAAVPAPLRAVEDGGTDAPAWS